jgi:hypothetical protein
LFRLIWGFLSRAFRGWNGFAVAVGGLGIAVAVGATLFILRARLHRRLAGNNKAVANRASFGCRFLAATGAFGRRSFVPFSIQHSNQTRTVRFGSLISRLLLAAANG